MKIQLENVRMHVNNDALNVSSENKLNYRDKSVIEKRLPKLQDEKITNSFLLL